MITGMSHAMLRCYLNTQTERDPTLQKHQDTDGHFYSGWQPFFVMLWQKDCVHFRQNGSLLPTQQAFSKNNQLLQSACGVTGFNQWP